MARRSIREIGRLVAALTAVALVASTTPAAWADDLGASSGGQAGTLSQVAQTLQQLTQQINGITQVVSQLTQATGSALNAVTTILGGAGGGILGGAGSILNGIGGGVLGGIGGILGGLGGGGGGALFNTIGSLVQSINRLVALSRSIGTSWLPSLGPLSSTVLGQAQSSVWAEWGADWGETPDYAYTMSAIVPELESLASSLPGSAGQWVATLANRLARMPAPQPGSPQDDAARMAAANPTFAARARGVQQSLAASVATQAASQAAAETANAIAQSATSDTTPSDSAAASLQAAQDAGTALASAPSTRAAIEVLGTALTQQQAQSAAQQAAIASRLDALISQQAAIATQLSQVAAGLASVSGLLAQTINSQLEDQSQQSAMVGDSVGSTASGIAAELQFLGSQQGQASVDNMLNSLKSLGSQ